MVQNDPFQAEDFKKCAAFHGHICPGLAIGYRSSKRGMAWLKENRAEDEEVVAIVETNACGADAVQVLTGCTFGKGNFFFKDYGKQALTLISRNSGDGIRVALKAEILMMNTGDTDPTFIETNIPWVTRCISDDRQMGYLLVDYLYRKRGFQRVGIIRSM